MDQNFLTPFFATHVEHYIWLYGVALKTLEGDFPGR